MNGFPRPALAGLALTLVSLALASGASSALAQTPTGKANGKIAFVSFRDGDPEIYTMNPDGSQPIRRTFNAGPTPELPLLDFWPSWRSDGAKIVYTSFRVFGPGPPNGDIYIMNPDGTGNVRVTTHPAGDLDPAFFPDGRRIVFVREFPGETEEDPPVQDIYAVNTDGTGEANLTESAANETEPAVSPDGRRIVFEREVAPGNHEIFTMNADGTGETRLTFTVTAEGHPNFSPDGRKIVFDNNFHADPGVPGAIHTMNLDGSGLTTLTSNRNDRHGLAAYSPDGTKILFTASEDIWVMNADGTGQRPLTTHPAPDIQASWQPLPVAATPVSSAFAGCPAASASVIRGTAAGNPIVGTPRGDRIFAGTGNDTVDGLAGDDCIDLGPGTDGGQGGDGNDLLLGGLDRDRLAGDRGNDRLNGGSSADRLNGGFGDDRLHGQSGADRVSGSRGRDRINGGSANDAISAGSSNDRVAGDQGNDRINGNSGNDLLRGNSGNDSITGSTGADRISGGSGDDRINSRDGRRDRVNCGRGRDRVVADRVDVIARNCNRVRRGR